MTGRNRNAANRHHIYREILKQLNRSLREYANELEATNEYKDEEIEQLKNQVAEHIKQISVLAAKIRAKRGKGRTKREKVLVKQENKTRSMASQTEPEEGVFELVFVSQDPTSELGAEFQNDTGPSTIEDSTVNLQYQRLEEENILLKEEIILLKEENILLKEEVEMLRNENNVMKKLAGIIANPSCLEVIRQDLSSQNEEKLDSTSIEEANGQQGSSESHDPISNVKVLVEQVDRSQLLETNQDCESVDAHNGWNYTDSWAEDQVVHSTVCIDTGANENPFRRDPTEEELSKSNQEMIQESVYQDVDEMETE